LVDRNRESRFRAKGEGPAGRSHRVARAAAATTGARGWEDGRYPPGRAQGDVRGAGRRAVSSAGWSRSATYYAPKGCLE